MLFKFTLMYASFTIYKILMNVHRNLANMGVHVLTASMDTHVSAVWVIQETTVTKVITKLLILNKTQL